MKYKYEILLICSIVLIYGALSYFSDIGLPLKITLMTINTVIFFPNIKSCEDTLSVFLPIILVSIILSKILINWDREWVFVIGSLIYLVTIFIYSYIKKLLIVKLYKSR